MDIDGDSLVIAIDGPSGSGKTTVARSVAMQLGLPHLDTGAYYRAATVAVLRRGADPTDEAAVVAVVRDADLSYDRGRMLLDGDDVSDDIRTQQTTDAVSAVSAIAEVREMMVDRQRQWVIDRGGSAVVEGRDIGSVVFPAATLKLFVTARPEIRAMRRAGETRQDESAVHQDLARRDAIDSTRSTSPLTQADGAVLIDTSDLSIDEVIARVLNLVKSRVG